ncbi:hypothetical protein B6U90_01300 [Thermoplasmatales archaeon ex4484_6]|nr:MAG: hypothetical protein B6U90_01300 [Thermoplasmatales archaeon ex4484_6]RLF67799.1 MAG: hypothetical protein DRN57_05205 [Thermoplasmata archaeon]
MVKVQFCPLCSAYLRNRDLEKCPKCGVDLERELDRKRTYEESLKRKSETVQGPFHPVLGRTCPICGEEVEILPAEVLEFTVYGEVCGKGPMGDLRAPMQVFIGFQPWRCRRKHMLFSSYEVERRELCPRCLTPNVSYGKLVRSCTGCGTMVPVEYYHEGDPIELMKKRGYHHAPELE